MTLLQEEKEDDKDSDSDEEEKDEKKEDSEEKQEEDNSEKKEKTKAAPEKTREINIKNLACKSYFLPGNDRFCIRLYSDKSSNMFFNNLTKHIS